MHSIFTIKFLVSYALSVENMKFRFQWEQEAGGCGHKERTETGNMLSHAVRPRVKFSVVYYCNVGKGTEYNVTC